MADFCRNYSRVAWAHSGTKEAIFTRLRCKQWSCEYCAGVNAKMWRGHLANRLPEISQNWAFLTLTAPADKREKHTSLAAIRDNIERLMKRMKRVFGAIEYVRVYERHPASKAIHAHLIVSGVTPYVVNGASIKHVPQTIGVFQRSKYNCWAAKSWFKKIAVEVDMGYILDLQFIGAGEYGRVIHYISKYMTKSQQDIGVKGLRHIQVSRAIGSPHPETGEPLFWQVGSYIAAEFFAPNTKITDLNTGFIIDNNYWETTTMYPHDFP